jgi:hypothetical protein
MASEPLFGSEFLERVVEWSNLSKHSGKLFCSLERNCEDALGYVSVGNDVIEYAKMKEEVARSPEASAAQFEHLKTIIKLPTRPHSSMVKRGSALERVNHRLSLRGRLVQIQEREFQGAAAARGTRDPLEKCLNLQNEAADDFSSQLSKFPDRIKVLSPGPRGSIVVDYRGLPLKGETIEALSSVTFGDVALLGGQEGLIFKFKYFSRSRMCFVE